MAKHIERQYWCACTLMKLIKKKEDYAKDVLKYFALAERKEIKIVSSNISHIEVRARDGDSAEVKDFIHKMFYGSTIEIVEVDAKIVKRAVVLASTHNLQAADAIHVATAEAREVDVMFSTDTRVRGCNGHLGFPIVPPKWDRDEQTAFEEFRHATGILHKLSS